MVRVSLLALLVVLPAAALAASDYESRANAVATVSVPAVPGALVCGDLNTVSFVARLYTDSRLQVLQDALTGGQSRLVRGAPMPPPDPSFYGCTLLMPGTKVWTDMRRGFPVILGPAGDIVGVTLPGMVKLIAQ